MSSSVPRRRGWSRTLTLAVFLGVAIHLAGFVLFTVRPLPQLPAAKLPPTISLLPTDRKDEDPRLREYMALTDPRVLYRPNSRALAADTLQQAARRVPGDAFDVFQPQMAFATTALPPLVPASRIAPDSPLAALRTGDRAQFAEFGRTDRPETVREPVAGYLTVRSLQGGALVFRESLVNAPAALTQQDWAPAEFTVAVTAGGVVGTPVLAKSSTLEELDRVLRTYLARDAHLGERLAPGFYRVVLSP